MENVQMQIAQHNPEPVLVQACCELIAISIACVKGLSGLYLAEHPVEDGLKHG